MSYWIRQVCLIVLGVLLSGLPLEMSPSDPGSSPSATQLAPETDRRPAESAIRLCVRASVAPVELDVRVRTQSVEERVKNNKTDRSLTLCLGPALPSDETDRSTTGA